MSHLFLNDLVTYITDNLPTLLELGLDMLKAVADGIVQAIPELLENLPQIVESLATFFADSLPMIAEAGIDILLSLVSGIISAIPRMAEMIPEVISSIVSTLADNYPKIIEAGFGLLIKLGEGILSAIPELVANLPQVAEAVLEGLGAIVSGVVDIGKNIVSGLWDGISSMGNWIKDKVTGFIDGIVDAAKSLLGIASPSKVFVGIGENVTKGLAQGITDNAQISSDALATISNGFQTKMALPFSMPQMSDFQIPAIAEGRVVPPRLYNYFNAQPAEMAAPTVSDMAQAFEIALRNMGGFGNNGNVNISFNGSLAQLARVLQPEITAETKRRGPSLVTGGA